MFEIDLEKQLQNFNLRKNKITKLDKVPIKDIFYLDFISRYKAIEIAPDFVLLDYEKALNSNNYIKNNFPSISNKFWHIADTGQGDEWFIDIVSQKVCFYDHNQGEYLVSKFSTLDISFEKFLILSFIIKKLEEYLDNDIEEISLKRKYKNALDKISINLIKNYPYDYF